MKSLSLMIPPVASHYGKALFDLAVEADSVAQIEKDLLYLEKLLSLHPILSQTMKSPLFSSKEQAFALDAIAQKIGLSPLLKNFLGVLSLNRRFFYIDAIISAYHNFCASARRQVFVSCVSSHTLSQSYKDDLTKTLEKRLGKNVRAQYIINEELLDGLILQIGSYRIDASLKTALKLLETTLKEVP